MSARVVLVTGASSGIGSAAAQQIAARGEHLVLASRGGAALRATERECRAAGAASVRSQVVDITDADAVQRLVDSVVTGHGRLDAVLQCAGVVAYGRFEDIPVELFDGVIRTNVLGSANVLRSTLPVLRRQRHGVAVLIGSVLGEVSVPFMAPYGVSKWALRSLARQVALENRDLADVHVCILSPGGVDTPIYRQAANYLGRPGRPPAPVDSADKVARAAVRLLDRPRDRASVGLANHAMRLGFSLAPRVFDALVGPLFTAAALTRERIAPTQGNVLRPQEELEEVDGHRGQGLRTAATSLVSPMRPSG